MMAWYIIKIAITALIIVVVSEISKRLPLLGSLIASLPLVSVLGMIWIFQETKDTQKLITHAEGTFWYVLPSLPMFLLMPWMMKKGVSFHWSITAGILLTILLYLIMTKLLNRMGMNL
jgi:F0F1-type ATP synthase assembly protein I